MNNRKQRPKRSRIEIIAEILTKSSLPISPTSLLKKCRLIYSDVSEKLDLLIACGLLTEKSNGNGRLVSITEKGKQFLKLYIELLGLLR